MSIAFPSFSEILYSGMLIYFLAWNLLDIPQFDGLCKLYLCFTFFTNLDIHVYTNDVNFCFGMQQTKEDSSL